MTEEDSEDAAKADGQPGKQLELNAGYDSYRSLADSNLVIIVPKRAVPPFRFKAGGWEPLQSSVELDPEAKARVDQLGYLIETKTPKISGELFPNEPNLAATSSLEVEFALVIARMIDSVGRSPEDMRKAIYELARHKLAEQLPNTRPEEREHTQRALEVAIRGVETFSQEHARTLPAVHQPQLRGPADVPIDRKPSLAPELVPQAGPGRRSGDSAGRTHKSDPWPYIKRTAAMIAVLVAALMMIQHREGVLSLARDLSKSDWKIAAGERSAAPQADIPVPPAPPPTPARVLPTDYGIYAIADSPIRLNRIAVTTALTAPSQTVLPNGHVKFVIFSRDLAATIGDHAEVRILAKVAREVSTNVSGTKPADDAWVIRNISFPFRSSPVKDNPEMNELHSEDPDLVLTPGRYALILRAQAYDFSVEGKVVDPRHCIERVFGSASISYSSCTRP